MALYFTGTSTGKKYEVGQDYKTGTGAIMTAQPDGSFVKKGNFVAYTDQGRPVYDNSGAGQVSPGSSGNRDVEWFASGGEAAAYRAAGGYSAPGAAMGGGSPTLPAPAAPQGTIQVPPPQRSAAAVTAANRGAFLGAFNQASYIGPFNYSYLDKTRPNNAWSGEQLPPQDMLVGGFHLQANPNWSNGEVVEMLFGDNEVVSTLYSLFHVPAVVGYNARLVAEQNGFDSGRGVTKAIDRALRPENVGDVMANAFSGINKWAAEEKAAAAAEDKWYADFNDVEDYKLQLQKEEWDKTFTVLNAPNQEPRLAPNVWGY